MTCQIVESWMSMTSLAPAVTCLGQEVLKICKPTEVDGGICGAEHMPLTKWMLCSVTGRVESVRTAAKGEGATSAVPVFNGSGADTARQVPAPASRLWLEAPSIRQIPSSRSHFGVNLQLLRDHHIISQRCSYDRKLSVGAKSVQTQDNQGLKAQTKAYVAVNDDINASFVATFSP